MDCTTNTRNTTDQSVEAVRAFYNGYAEREWTRADRNFFEFEVTKAYISRFVKPGDRVLDVGGGPGRYSLWLSELGADVTMLELSDENVAMAKKQAALRGLPLTAIQGDARFTDALTEGEFDHVLLMGPLYHLTEESDRVMTVEACLRRLKKGGCLFTAFISNYSNLVYMLSKNPEMLLDPNEQKWIDTLKTGVSYAGPAFTDAYFIQPGEIIPFMERFPLKTCHLFACEGPTAAFQHVLSEASDELKAAWLDLSLTLCEREELLSWAEHLMHIGEKI
ncbi:MAG: class I SAM-dependent methyltransferase [Oscillospiraceae bacterium]|nr:class I SAM-dependent methyltransferase [Oscillospiraceae bacterium]